MFTHRSRRRRTAFFIRFIVESKQNRTSPAPTDLPEGALEPLELVVTRAYGDLRAIAHQRLLRGAGGTLTTTALVHETYLKLIEQSPGVWRGRGHFLAVASLAMRYVLVDRARARHAAKRGGGDHLVTFDDESIAADDQAVMILELNEALERLAEWDERLARVVDCRFFGGLSETETAEALGLTVRTVRRDWVKARILLRRALES
jgi:RNA polymerase sigma factor (TIGR02999 family)